MVLFQPQRQLFDDASCQSLRALKAPILQTCNARRRAIRFCEAAFQNGQYVAKENHEQDMLLEVHYCYV